MPPTPVALPPVQLLLVLPLTQDLSFRGNDGEYPRRFLRLARLLPPMKKRRKTNRSNPYARGGESLRETFPSPKINSGPPPNWSTTRRKWNKMMMDINAQRHLPLQHPHLADLQSSHPRSCIAVQISFPEHRLKKSGRNAGRLTTHEPVPKVPLSRD